VTGVDGDAAERLRILAHELRSPVAALAALVEAAPRLRDATERERLVALGIAAGRDVERLLTDPDLLSLRRQRLDLGALATGFAADRVEVRVAGDAPVDADPTRVRQVIANLVANGLRHGERVAIEVAEEDGHAVVVVSDDGPGVETGLDPFARGAGTAGSTGYGLWLARAIAEAHGGSLDLVRDDGAGARFRLALPSASAGR
jgi:signal transduction histidine kinase